MIFDVGLGSDSWPPCKAAGIEPEIKAYLEETEFVLVGH